MTGLPGVRLPVRILGRVRTFITLTLAAVSGLHAAGEQRRTTDNPCVDRQTRSPTLFLVDEAPSKPTFFEYRAWLRTAVERHDVEAVRLDTPVVAPVSYSIVRLIDRADVELWSHVQLGDGRRGYIWHAYVRSPADYRALFALIDGRWRMTAFVSGD